MINLFIVVAGLISFQLVHAFQSTQAYVNIEEDDAPVSVFKSPGQNWKYCKTEIDPETKKQRCIDAVGWPDRNSQIRIVGPSVKVKTIDPFTDEPMEISYTEVEFVYSRKGNNGENILQVGQGFIESDYLSSTPPRGFYSPANPVKDPCPPDRKDPQATTKEISKSAEALATSIQNMSIADKAKQVSQHIGFCPLKPPTRLPSDIPEAKIYDTMIAQKLRSERPPAVTNEKGQSITAKEIIAIDSLARTMYGEMASCYKKGLQYPMTLARIALNRSESKGRLKEFVKPPQKDDKPSMAKVATSESQFLVWKKRKRDGTQNPSVHKALCPPANPEGQYWNKGKPSTMENDVWKNTVRIATEAVLHPTRFKERTKQVNGFFYTSYLAKEQDKYFMKNMRREYPDVEGRRVQDGCLEVWKE